MTHPSAVLDGYLRKGKPLKKKLSNRFLFVLASLLLILSSFAFIATSGISRTNLIITRGIHFVDAMRIVAWCFLSVSAVALLFGSIRLFRRAAAGHAAELETARNLNGPDEIRAELAHWMKDRPQLSTSLQTAFDQLQSIGRKRSRATSLFATMLVGFERQTMMAIDSVERTICKRVKLIICRAILCDPEEVNAEEVVNHQAAIHNLLETNRKTIATCEDLLAQIVEHNEGEQRDSHVEEFANIISLIDVLNDLNAQNIKN